MWLYQAHASGVCAVRFASRGPCTCTPPVAGQLRLGGWRPAQATRVTLTVFTGGTTIYRPQRRAPFLRGLLPVPRRPNRICVIIHREEFLAGVTKYLGLFPEITGPGDKLFLSKLISHWIKIHSYTAQLKMRIIGTAILPKTKKIKELRKRIVIGLNNLRLWF